MFPIKALYHAVINRKTINSFNFNVVLILVLTLLNILYPLDFSISAIRFKNGLWNPTWLLFGPFIYFGSNSLKNDIKNSPLHFLPAFLFLILFCIAAFHSTSINTLYLWYQSSYWIIPVSLIGYSLKVIADCKENLTRLNAAEELLVVSSGIYFLIAILYSMIYICYQLQIDMGIDYRFFIYSLLLVTIVFLVRYSYLTRPIKTGAMLYDVTNMGDNSYANSGLDEKQIRFYTQQINHYFNEQQAFLRSDLSLDVLSKELNIPKHYFSQLFNSHIGKSFYSFVAEYRIGYAIQFMQKESGKLKIESLAYACGFNSKTSFNRYFKNITGYTPIEYLNQQVEKGRNMTPPSINP